jgi:hypothetical protein
MPENESQIIHVGICYGNQKRVEEIALADCQELANSYDVPCDLTIVNIDSGETSEGTAFPQTSKTIWGFSEAKGSKAMNWEKVFAQRPGLIGKGN